MVAIGITNQRETTLVWERATGKPLHNAIVWQDRRTADICARMKAAWLEDEFSSATGLVLDPYFSGTKLQWLLDNVDGLRARAERGEVCFGTVDSYLVWRLTGGAAHVTDVSNASRTLLFDLHTLDWERRGCCDAARACRAPCCPTCAARRRASTARRAACPGCPTASRSRGIAGDQQAALFGQACFAVGDAKCTYGTGAFMLMNTGDARGAVAERPAHHRRLEARRRGGLRARGLDVHRRRDGAVAARRARHHRDRRARSRRWRASVPDSGGVVAVPALAGLGAPHWRPEARGLISGLTRGTTKAHLARAVLEGIALQIGDLLGAMQADAGVPVRALKVDGGASANNLLMQFQADVLGCEIVRPALVETTALGAALLAGIAAGVWKDTGDAARAWKEERRFTPADGRKPTSTSTSAAGSPPSSAPESIHRRSAIRAANLRRFSRLTDLLLLD